MVHKKIRQLINFSCIIGLIILLLFFLFPIIWMFFMSIKTRVDALAMPPKFIFQPTLANYISVFTNQKFIHGFYNSLIVGIFSLIIVLLVGVPASYALARYTFKHKKDIAFWILSTRMAPPIAVLIPFYLLFRTLGLTDTRFSLIITHITINLALVIWMMRSFLQDVPSDLEEAALIDGCTPMQSFIKIILPLCANGIIATSILGFVFSWNDLLFGLVLSGANAKTAPVFVANYISYQEIMWGQLCASGIIVTIPVIIFIGFVQRYLIRGLTLGAIKG